MKASSKLAMLTAVLAEMRPGRADEIEPEELAPLEQRAHLIRARVGQPPHAVKVTGSRWAQFTPNG